jgi:myo-inositol 2-dehydrogenase / D-chiro-inositol 1-dehydrogenase
MIGDERVRTAVIGLGAIGPTHARWCASVPESTLVAVCDASEPRAREVAERFGVQPYTDYHDVLARDDVDAVIIATPSFLHARMAIDAARAGKHIAVEKPLCTTLEDADALIAAVNEAGVRAQYFENLCFSPSYRMAKEIIAADGIGELYFVRCREGSGGGVRAHREVYAALETGQPAGGEGEALGSWYVDYEKAGGGQLMSTGCHCIAYMRWLMDRDPVTSVYAALVTLVGPDPRVEDAAYLTLTHQSGAVGWVDTTLIDALGTFDDRAEIYGSKGSIFLDLYRSGQIKVYSQEGYGAIGSSMFGRIEGAGTNWSYPIADEYWALGYEGELRAFLHSIIDSTTPEVTLEDGRATLQVISAGYESARTRNAVAL